MPICISCFYEINNFTRAKDNTVLCNYCKDEGMAKIEGDEVIILKEPAPLKEQPKRGRKKGFKLKNKPRQKTILVKNSLL